MERDNLKELLITAAFILLHRRARDIAIAAVNTAITLFRL
jgi:hypothetical protein